MDVMGDLVDDELFGHVVVIKRDGSDGGRFPLYEEALIGRYEGAAAPHGDNCARCRSLGSL